MKLQPLGFCSALGIVEAIDILTNPGASPPTLYSITIIIPSPQHYVTHNDNNTGPPPPARRTPAPIDGVAVDEAVRGDVFPAVRVTHGAAARARQVVWVYSMAMTLSFYSVGIWTAIANLTVRDGRLELSKLSSSGGAGTSPQRSRLAAGLYLAGVIFNALHFAFAPRDLALIEVVMDEGKVHAGKGGDNCTAMADWVSMNVVRGLVADLLSIARSLFRFIVVMT
ncbi:hypothetical protein DL765_011109 [Monosporascus sp. GIB2]|nr:hypothetical protein DL765_011109 [Monosporascus sp. GIB2]